MSVLIYGASDDLIEVDGDVSAEFNAYDFDGYLAFSNGVTLSVNYTRDGIWRIDKVSGDDSLVKIEKSSKGEGDGVDGLPAYSDKAVLDGQIEWVAIVKGARVRLGRAFIMNIFNRKMHSNSLESRESPYVECRAWNGTAFHIRDLRREDGAALCGYMPLDDREGVTAEDYIERRKFEHAGWHYCHVCGPRLLELNGQSEQTPKK